MSRPLVADGSSPVDAHPTVTIDLSDPSVRWQYGCPAGHTTIEATNGGYWCRSCARDTDIEDPHYHDLIDKRTGEEIPWSAVEVV